MSTTATFGFRTPDSTSNVQLWTHFQNLAGDVDALLAMVWGLPAPTTSAQGGTTSSGSTSTRDDVLGVYAFTVPASAATWRFETFLMNRMPNFTASDDIAVFEIRDGGGSVPTSTSPLVASAQIRAQSTGGTGQESLYPCGTWIPGAGTHTLAAFSRRAAGTGTITPVPTGPSTQLGVRFVGLH